jgi:hypothetical protein
MARFAMFFGAAYLAHGLGRAIMSGLGVFFLIVFVVIGVDLIGGMPLIIGVRGVLGAFMLLACALLVTGNWIGALILGFALTKVADWLPDRHASDYDWTWTLSPFMWHVIITVCVTSLLWGMKIMLQPYLKQRQQLAAYNLALTYDPSAAKTCTPPSRTPTPRPQEARWTPAPDPRPSYGQPDWLAQGRRDAGIG